MLLVITSVMSCLQGQLCGGGPGIGGPQDGPLGCCCRQAPGGVCLRPGGWRLWLPSGALHTAPSPTPQEASACQGREEEDRSGVYSPAIRLVDACVEGIHKDVVEISLLPNLLWSTRMLVRCILGLNLLCLCCIVEWHELLLRIASNAYMPLQPS